MSIIVNTTNISFPANNLTQDTAGSPGLTQLRFYTAPGTYTRPATTAGTYNALKFVKITAIGGGGGGSASYAVNYPTNSFWESYGVPGGNGGFASAFIPVNNIPTSAIPITVGSGGNGGVAPAGSGSPGGSTVFGTLIYASGGDGGVTSPTAYGGPSTLAGTGIYPGAGAPFLPIAVNNNTNINIGLLGSPGWVMDGYGIVGALVPYTPSPSGGTSPGGAGGFGTGYGPGGGGGTTSPYSVSPSPTTPGFAGGAGAPGFMIIEEFY